MAKKSSEGSNPFDGNQGKEGGRVSFDESQKMMKNEPGLKDSTPLSTSSRWSFDEATSVPKVGETQSKPVELKDGDIVKQSIESRASFDQTTKSDKDKPKVVPEIKTKSSPEIKGIPSAKVAPGIKVSPEIKVTPGIKVSPEIKVAPQGKAAPLITNLGTAKKDPKEPPKTPKDPILDGTKKPPMPKDLSGKSGTQEKLKAPSGLDLGKLRELKDKMPSTNIPATVKSPFDKKARIDIKSKLKAFLDKLKQNPKDIFGSKKMKFRQHPSISEPPKERTPKPPFPSLIIMSEQKGAATVGRAMKFPYTFTAQLAQFPYKFHLNNCWLYKYYVIAVGVALPVFYKIGKASNSPGNKRTWDEIRRKAFTPGEHH